MAWTPIDEMRAVLTDLAKGVYTQPASVQLVADRALEYEKIFDEEYERLEKSNA